MAGYHVDVKVDDLSGLDYLDVVDIVLVRIAPTEIYVAVVIIVSKG